MNTLHITESRSSVHEFCSKHFICGSVVAVVCHLVNFILCLIYYESKLPAALVLLALFFNVWWCLFRLSLMKYYNIPSRTDCAHILISCFLHWVIFGLFFVIYLYYFAQCTNAYPRFPAFSLCAPLSFCICLVYNSMIDAFLFLHPDENEDILLIY
jgi:hypothetical protein